MEFVVWFHIAFNPMVLWVAEGAVSYALLPPHLPHMPSVSHLQNINWHWSEQGLFGDPVET